MAGKPNKPDENVLSPIAGVVVPADEYAEVERQALAGSSEAAFRLARQYESTARYVEAIFWGSIAAENGSQVGAYNLGYTLAGSPDPKQRIRARFWLRRAAEGGGETGRLAASFLKELDDREKLGTTIQVPFPERYPKW